MKLLMVFFATAVLSLNALASSDPRLDPNSFISLTLARGAKPNKVQLKLGAQCVAALRARKAIVHSDLLPRYLIPIKNVPFQDTADGVFFHYTDHAEVVDIVKRQANDEIFSFLRSKTDDPFLYLASDDRSSIMFGINQIRIHINPEEPVFMPMDPRMYAQAIAQKDLSPYGFPKDIPVTDPVYDEVKRVTSLIVTDLIAKSPSLNACATKGPSDLADGNILLLLALENARVPVVAYDGTVIGWFHLMGTWAIDADELGSTTMTM